MATISEKLNTLNTIKSDIKGALEAKGATPNDDFTTYATEIQNLSTGGGDTPGPYTIIIPNKCSISGSYLQFILTSDIPYTLIFTGSEHDYVGAGGLTIASNTSFDIDANIEIKDYIKKFNNSRMTCTADQFNYIVSRLRIEGNITSMFNYYTIKGKEGETSVNLNINCSKWNVTGSVSTFISNMDGVIYGSYTSNTLDVKLTVKNLDLINLEDTNYFRATSMFSNVKCISELTLDTLTFNTALQHATSAYSSWFYNCTKIKQIKLPNCTSAVRDWILVEAKKQFANAYLSGTTIYTGV